MALLAERLVGRADELGSLERLLDELDRGHPGAIELAGEPGIGKTRLLRHESARRGRPRRAVSTLQLRLKIC
jgi:predicted ATPase